MKKLLVVFSTLSLTLSLNALSTEQNAANNSFNSTLWTQTSAEYAANSLQIFNTAARNLSLVLQQTNKSAALEQTREFAQLPPAVIMDIDETVLDNSSYQAKQIIANKSWDPVSWDNWIKRQQATAVPGAVKFIQLLKHKNIKVLFVTNRACKVRIDLPAKCPQKLDTIKNLEKVGIKNVTTTDVLLKNDIDKNGNPFNWGSEKKSRRQYLAKKYHIIMLFGDNLGDFLAGVIKDITPAQRLKLLQKYQTRWGLQWYILSNPAYGSWLNILERPKAKYLKSY